MDARPPLPEEMIELPLGLNGLRGWKIATPFCRALVSQQGAQLLEFQAVGKKPLLWLSEQAAYAPGRAIRGGIPLCFPWFGPHPQDPAKPAHGFARSQRWALAGAETVGETLQLSFRLAASPETRALWPHEFIATLTMILGRTLTLQLMVENTGGQDFRFCFAFHSYFPVGDIRQTRVEGLEGCQYIDQLAPDRAPRRQSQPIRFEAETDRIYLHTPDRYCLVDEDQGQAVRITAQGCRSVVVWNPWDAKAASLADMADAAWQHMVCVESGNLESDAIVLPAGASKAFSILLESEA